MKENGKFYNASNDYLFKHLFYHHNFLSTLLKDLFGVDISNFKYSTVILPKENQNKSKGECDVVLESDEEIITLEMQNNKRGSLENRSMVYLSKLYGMQWKKGDTYYEEIKPVTLYWLLNYQYKKSEILEYQMLETKLHDKFGENLKVQICNINKLKDKKYQLLFQAKSKEELEELKRDSKLGPMVKEIIKFNLKEKEYERMEMLENMWTLEDEKKFQRMEAHREGRLAGKKQGLKEGRKEGRKEGLKQGEKKGLLKVASKLLSKGLPMELIMEVTTLSKSEIQKMNKVEN